MSFDAHVHTANAVPFSSVFSPSVCLRFIFPFARTVFILFRHVLYSVHTHVLNGIVVNFVDAQSNRVDELCALSLSLSQAHTQTTHMFIHLRCRSRVVPPLCSHCGQEFLSHFVFISNGRSSGIESTSGFPSRQSIRLLSFVRLVFTSFDRNRKFNF